MKRTHFYSFLKQEINRKFMQTQKGKFVQMNWRFYWYW